MRRFAANPKVRQSFIEECKTPPLDERIIHKRSWDVKVVEPTFPSHPWLDLADVD